VLSEYSNQATGWTTKESPKCPYQSRAQSNPQFSRLKAISPRIKRPGCEAEQKPQSSTEVQKRWSYKFFQPLRLHGVQWDSLAFDITDSQYTVQVCDTKHMARYTYISFKKLVCNLCTICTPTPQRYSGRTTAGLSHPLMYRHATIAWANAARLISPGGGGAIMKFLPTFCSTSG
jgi:hypothetical protein